MSAPTGPLLTPSACQGLADALNAPVCLRLLGREAILGRWCWTVPGELCVRVSSTLDEVRAQLLREGYEEGWFLNRPTGELTPLRRVGV